MRTGLLFLCMMSLGCQGPMPVPMVARLNPEEQQAVDDSWANMLTPVNRLDRTLLLDVILTNQFHQRGVDQLRLVSEKRVRDGLVIMEVRFDRENPAFDEFTFAYVDKAGHELRRERYSREDVNQRLQLFAEATISSAQADADNDATDLNKEIKAKQEAQQAVLEERQAALAARMMEIQAATQPAIQP